MTDRYEELCMQWADKIKSIPPENLQRKLPELYRNGSSLCLRYFDQEVIINLKDGTLHSLDAQGSLSMNARLNIYTLLWYCKDGAKLSGQWLPFRSMKNASPFAPAFQKHVLNPLAQLFDGREETLLYGVEKLRGFRIDAHSYYVSAFTCMPLRILFWDGDDEFSAQANILFDKNATDFIHVESLVTIASECVRKLAQVCNLSLSKESFS
ncbi:MAG: DUF3786 domain-containing protein [Oscillospiraceae bacterium]|nr:DUF3786 domain-containing protein [Oscillospiraceae bacterium]